VLPGKTTRVVAEKRPGNSQGLSPTALRDKRARDKAAAMTPLRKKRKKENQAIGQESDKDLHHTKSGAIKRTSIAYNRATHDRNEVKT